MSKSEIRHDSLRCGIIMPISDFDGCGEQHWREVKSILTDAIKNAGFTAELVSDADDIGIIQKRIIQNIYENPIIVCDVSGKNPNVMFELGLRLAFDKPTIIVKDEKTNYSFDTSPIEHLTYPRDLRYLGIVEFKEKLAAKIKGTYDKSRSDPSYTTFLKNFGEFTSPKLETKEISKEDYIIEEVRQLKKEIAMYGRRQFEVPERNDRLAYEIDNLIENEILYCKTNNEAIDVGELRKSIHASNAIRNLSMRAGLSTGWVNKHIDRALERHFSNENFKDNIV